ncbi:MAG TPA: hypothetical protein VEB42_00015, partial [Chitinophagaceae bacterium]|nr:hypothetical protein [Chitinophagaceae bacterium]
VSFLRKDLALVTALGVRYDKSGGVPEDPTAIMTILFEKKQEEWKIISFHNHGFDNSLKTTSPVPMKVMFASWYAE